MPEINSMVETPNYRSHGSRGPVKPYHLFLADLTWPENTKPRILIPNKPYPGKWIKVTEDGKNFLKWSKHEV